jgi:hypothetical protein
VTVTTGTSEVFEAEEGVDGMPTNCSRDGSSARPSARCSGRRLPTRHGCFGVVKHCALVRKPGRLFLVTGAVSAIGPRLPSEDGVGGDQLMMGIGPSQP